MTERISGTVVDIGREWDRQASRNPMYVVDCDGRREVAVDYSQRWNRAEVGDQVVITGRRLSNGNIAIDTVEV